MIVLADVAARIVNRVTQTSRLTSSAIVTVAMAGPPKLTPTGLLRLILKDFVAFDERVFVDESGETLRGLAGSKAESAEGFDVVLALSGRHVGGVVIDARRGRKYHRCDSR